MNKATKQQKSHEPGGRANVFVLRYYYYVNVTFSSTLLDLLRYRSGRKRLSFTLRYRSGRNVFRLRYVTVAGVKRIAARVEGPWPSLPSAVLAVTYCMYSGVLHPVEHSLR